jgi:hypothetical protein
MEITLESIRDRIYATSCWRISWILVLRFVMHNVTAVTQTIRDGLK